MTGGGRGRGRGGKVALPANFGKRQTLTDRLDRLRQAPESERLEVFEQTEKESKEFKGFRHHAAKTQSRQDYHLGLYQDWMTMKEGRDVDDYDEDELCELCFPRDDPGQVAENIRQFLIVTYHKTAPRSRLTGERISYRSLTKFRDSLFFWAKYFAHQRSVEPPNASLLFRHAAEAMRAVIKSDPDPASEKSKQTMKSFIGLAELRVLKDYVMSTSYDIENAEQHMAAWDIARLCACRPGSICHSGQYARAPPLRWKDIEIQRDGEAGKFRLIIHFWNLNIKKPEDQERAEAERSSDSRHVELPSPQPSNLTFSAAHRLLVIAIRRGFLQGIDTIEELMDYPGKNIKIKPEYLDEPLFYRGKPKGMGVDSKRPLTVTALDQFLKRCCFAVGFTQQTIGMNSIRRRASSDLVARIGTEQTRRIMGHAPDTYTLERYYLFMGPMMNQTGILMDEDDNVQFKDIYRKRWAPMVTSKIDDPAIKRTRGAALRAMVDRLVLADPNPPDYNTEQERRSYRARLRLHAHRALLEHEKEESQQDLTQEQFEQRVSNLEASNFASAVLRRALELRKSGGDDAQFREQGNYQDEEDEEEDEEEEQDLDQMEVPKDGVIRIEFETELDEEAADDSAVSETSQLKYRDYATAFMDIMLHNRESTAITWKDKLDKTCPTCQEDPTVSDEDKMKEFNSQSHLDLHEASNFHTPLTRFRRMVDGEAAEHPDELYSCPYCHNCVDDRAKHYERLDLVLPPNEYQTRDDLEDHIKESSHHTDGEAHDMLKDEDGWYELDFYPKQLKSTKVKRHLKGVKELNRLGIKYHRIATQGGAGVQHKTIPGAVTGATPLHMPARFANLSSGGSVAATDGRLARLAVTGVPMSGLPSHVQGLVSYPSTGNFMATDDGEEEEGMEEMEEEHDDGEEDDEEDDEQDNEDEDEVMKDVGGKEKPVELSDNTKSSSFASDEDMED